MPLFAYLKKRNEETVGTRGERLKKKNKITAVLGLIPERTYRLGKVTYLVETKFEPSEKKKNLRQRFEKIIETDAAHLIQCSENDKMDAKEPKPTAPTCMCEKGA